MSHSGPFQLDPFHDSVIDGVILTPSTGGFQKGHNIQHYLCSANGAFPNKP